MVMDLNPGIWKAKLNPYIPKLMGPKRWKSYPNSWPQNQEYGMQDGSPNRTHGPKIQNIECMMELIPKLMVECKNKSNATTLSVALKVT